MNTDLSTHCFDNFPCRSFSVGKVEIGVAARGLLADDEITEFLNRHTHCDFGLVSWNHFNGNIQLIAELRGVITSIYKNSAGVEFRVATHLDEFNPFTRIFIA